MTTFIIIISIILWMAMGLSAVYISSKYYRDEWTYREAIFPTIAGPIALIILLICWITEASFWDKKLFFILLLVGLFSSCVTSTYYSGSTKEHMIITRTYKVNNPDRGNYKYFVESNGRFEWYFYSDSSYKPGQKVTIKIE